MSLPFPFLFVWPQTTLSLQLLGPTSLCETSFPFHPMTQSLPQILSDFRPTS